MTSQELIGEPLRGRDLVGHIRENRIATAPGWPVVVGFIASFAVAATLGVFVSRLVPWPRIGALLESISPFWIAVAGMVLALITALLVRLIITIQPSSVVEADHHEIARLKRKIDKVKAGFAEANDAVAKAAALMENLRADLARQEERRARIYAEVEEFQGWLVINDPEVQQHKKAQEALDRERDRAQNRQNRRYFIAGILLSIPIGIIINLLTG